MQNPLSQSPEPPTNLSRMDRYGTMKYRRAGRSGIDLPGISLGLWHNFGGGADPRVVEELVWTAFDHGITHFDLANNYGPPPGSAEESLARVLSGSLGAHRDELIISTKAGYQMGPGPYGDGGSRKYLLSSLEASLRRLRLDFVDVFYHHRRDPSTPLEETLGALASAVQQGKALYVGISNYDAASTATAVSILDSLGVHPLLHQPHYNLFDRRPEMGLLDTLERLGVGCIAFCPLDQGILAGKYLEGIPGDSRAAAPTGFLRPEQVTAEKLEKVRALKQIADARGQSLAQLALAWVLRRPVVTSALIGASRPAQIVDCLAALDAPALGAEELEEMDRICGHGSA